jgi:hypothetical protein
MTFTPATAVSAEGARIGLFTCDECGACVMLDPRDDDGENRLEQHRLWHKDLDLRIEERPPDA